MVIKILEASKPFKYLWLKNVDAVDLSQHCARCLVGKYDNRVSAKTIKLSDEKLNGDIYYLCGVSMPFVWENNFHLAFRKKEGSLLSFTSNGIAVVIENAERIMFSESDIDCNLPQSKNKMFYTCRNWQFANKLIKTI